MIRLCAAPWTAEASGTGLAPDVIDDGEGLAEAVVDGAALRSAGNRNGTKFTVFLRNIGSG